MKAEGQDLNLCVQGGVAGPGRGMKCGRPGGWVVGQVPG